VIPLGSLSSKRVERIEPDLGDRLRAAYATAMRAQQEGGRVEIHLGKDIIAYFQSLPPGQPCRGGSTAFGFPVVESEIPDHISIHTVQTIY
jgi:hypothetical protein